MYGAPGFPPSAALSHFAAMGGFGLIGGDYPGDGDKLRGSLMASGGGEWND